jgi:outer membrane receptor for ferrienterochelin and colicins
MIENNFTKYPLFKGISLALALKQEMGVRRGRFLVALATTCWVLSAWGGDLEGIISDVKTGETLPGVHVSIAGTKKGAASDEHGHYFMSDVPAGEQIVNIRVIGYETTSRKIQMARNGIIGLDIALEQSPWELDEIVVTATRRKHILKDVPVTTELITKDDMIATGALTVDQALDSHIGITVDNDLSGKGAAIRGIDPSRILILVDGHRVIGRVRGSIDLGQISVSDVDRIEIVKGSGSTLYGSDAMGGVINIITRKAESSRKLESSIEYGSFNTFDPELQLETKSPKFGVILSGKHEKTNGFDLDKSTPHTNGLEAIRRYNLNTKLSYSPRPSFYNDLSLGYMHERKIWVESEWHEGLRQTFVYNDYEWNDRYDVATSHRYVAGPNTDFEASAHGSFYNHDWEKYTSTGARDDSSITEDYILEGSLQANHVFAPAAILTTGGEYSSAMLKSTQIINGEKTVGSGDIYAQLELIPMSSLTFLPGIRWERHKTYGNHLNPSLNLKWSPNDRLAFRVTAGRGFRAPSIKELYFIFDHSAAGYIVYGGGEQLNPEKSNNYSLTSELNYGRRGLHRLTVFRNDLTNLIDFSLVEFTPTYWRGVYRYQNIVKARTQGLEWESKIKVCTGWDLSFSYAYLRAKNLTDKVDLINRPQHTAKFSSIFFIPKWNAGLTFWGTYTDRKLWTSQGDTPERVSNIYAPKRIVLNLNLYRRFLKDFEAYFRLENLTNDINATFGYWPPRSFTVGFRVNFSNGSRDPGSEQ